MPCYLVFGRRDYVEPLRQVGELEARPGDAAAASLERFGADWVELTLVPENELVWLLRAEEAP
ncbi:MAG: hypothetical protein ACE5EV_03270 [Gaiellales bacterium]